jgi:ferric-dicitrate binding protein FerR (iron transport regulator)
MLYAFSEAEATSFAKAKNGGMPACRAQYDRFYQYLVLTLGDGQMAKNSLDRTKPRQRWLAVAVTVALLVAAPLVLRKYLAESGDGTKIVATAEAPSPRPTALPDGSKVWLNSRSQLRHFAGNSSGERRVELTGEAYFEVAKQPSRPFVVQTALGEVTVLGTAFNVANRASKATLEVNVTEGLVRLQPTSSEQHMELGPGETGIFDEGKSTLTKETGQANNAAAWHTRRLVFDNTPAVTALRQLSAAYGVSLNAENAEIRQCPITASFEAQPLEAALETMATLLGAELVQVSDKAYSLRGGRCQ